MPDDHTVRIYHRGGRGLVVPQIPGGRPTLPIDPRLWGGTGRVADPRTRTNPANHVHEVLVEAVHGGYLEREPLDNPLHILDIGLPYRDELDVRAAGLGRPVGMAVFAVEPFHEVQSVSARVESPYRPIEDDDVTATGMPVIGQVELAASNQRSTKQWGDVAEGDG